MTRYLAGVLTVMAAGVLLVAYGLLNPRIAMDASTAMAPAMRPTLVAEPVSMQVPVTSDFTRSVEPSYVASGVRRTSASTVAASGITRTSSRPARRIETPKKNWTRTAMIIGGSSAAGAGVGAIVGGKKGALIGAAIGGGASTIYEVVK